MHCPKCQIDLVMSERQGVEIDYCPKCRGVWLDRGELDKILERAEGPTTRPSGASSVNTSLFGGQPTARPLPPPLQTMREDRDGRPARDYRRDDDDDDDRRKYAQGRRKSWLAEIFD